MIAHPSCTALACAFFVVSVQSPSAEQPSNALARSSSGPLRCEIQKNDKGDVIELIGLVASTRALSVSAHFGFVKSGASGSSDINQSQNFIGRADQQTIVGRAATDLGPGGHIAVDLRVGAGSLECRARASLER